MIIFGGNEHFPVENFPQKNAILLTNWLTYPYRNPAYFFDELQGYKSMKSMLIDNQAVEKNAGTTLAVVRKKSTQSAKVKVIKMAAPGSQRGHKTRLHPPVTQFNTGYIKAKDHDPL